MFISTEYFQNKEYIVQSAINSTSNFYYINYEFRNDK